MSGRNLNWTKEKINFIIQQYTSKKMNTYQLAKYFNCSDDTISRRLKENGISPHKFYEDLTGKKFGKLTVLKKSPKSARKIYWECKCECGNLVTVVGDSLRQKHTSSCGCYKKSMTESFISKLLKDNNISFIQQYTFKDLLGERNKPLRFDFAIMQNDKLSHLIEYDGELHFEEYISENGWNNKKNFKKSKERDIMKNNYCFKNNIPLIRIPCYHKDNITIEDLLLNTSTFIIQKESNNEIME